MVYNFWFFFYSWLMCCHMNYSWTVWIQEYGIKGTFCDAIFMTSQNKRISKYEFDSAIVFASSAWFAVVAKRILLGEAGGVVFLPVAVHHWAGVRTSILVLYLPVRTSTTSVSLGSSGFLPYLKLGFSIKILFCLIVLVPTFSWYDTATWYPYISWVIRHMLRKTKCINFIFGVLPECWQPVCTNLGNLLHQAKEINPQGIFCIENRNLQELVYFLSVNSQFVQIWAIYFTRPRK